MSEHSPGPLSPVRGLQRARPQHDGPASEAEAERPVLAFALFGVWLAAITLLVLGVRYWQTAGPSGPTPRESSYSALARAARKAGIPVVVRRDNTPYPDDAFVIPLVPESAVTDEQSEQLPSRLLSAVRDDQADVAAPLHMYPSGEYGRPGDLGRARELAARLPQDGRSRPFKPFGRLRVTFPAVFSSGPPERPTDDLKRELMRLGTPVVSSDAGLPLVLASQNDSWSGTIYYLVSSNLWQNSGIRQEGNARFLMSLAATRSVIVLDAAYDASDDIWQNTDEDEGPGLSAGLDHILAGRYGSAGWIAVFSVLLGLGLVGLRRTPWAASRRPQSNPDGGTAAQARQALLADTAAIEAVRAVHQGLLRAGAPARSTRTAPLATWLLERGILSEREEAQALAAAVLGPRKARHHKQDLLAVYRLLASPLVVYAIEVGEASGSTAPQARP